MPDFNNEQKFHVKENKLIYRKTTLDKKEDQAIFFSTCKLHNAYSINLVKCEYFSLNSGLKVFWSKPVEVRFLMVVESDWLLSGEETRLGSL